MATAETTATATTAAATATATAAAAAAAAAAPPPPTTTATATATENLSPLLVEQSVKSWRIWQHSAKLAPVRDVGDFLFAGAHGPHAGCPRMLAEFRLLRGAGREVRWAANKRFEVSKFEFKFPRARTFELYRARSRLYRRQI